MEGKDQELTDDLNALSYQVIGFAIEVHRQLGPGLLESDYQTCLFYELQNAGFKECAIAP